MPSERYTIADIRAANARAGLHFFDRDSMRFFDSRIARGGPYCGPGGVYFITSEQFHGSQGSAPRAFTVRSFDPATGEVETARGCAFNSIRDIDDARALARQYARAGVPEVANA